jgi:hypothetical protein
LILSGKPFDMYPLNCKYLFHTCCALRYNLKLLTRFVKQFLEEPVDLNSFVPPTAKRFALRQLELMEMGRGRRTARIITEYEFAEELK